MVCSLTENDVLTIVLECADAVYQGSGTIRPHTRLSDLGLDRHRIRQMIDCIISKVEAAGCRLKPGMDPLFADNNTMRALAKGTFNLLMADRTRALSPTLARVLEGVADVAQPQSTSHRHAQFAAYLEGYRDAHVNTINWLLDHLDPLDAQPVDDNTDGDGDSEGGSLHDARGDAQGDVTRGGAIDDETSTAGEGERQ